MKKSSGQFMNVGGASVIVIFVVLCLSMLGALAVSTSFADLRLSTRYQDSISRYYEADGQAQEKIFSLKENLLKKGLNEQAVREVLEDAKVSTSPYGGMNVSFLQTIDEKQSLDVRLSITTNMNQVLSVKVTGYKAVRTQKDIYESEYRLWDGTFQ